MSLIRSSACSEEEDSDSLETAWLAEYSAGRSVCPPDALSWHAAPLLAAGAVSASAEVCRLCTNIEARVNTQGNINVCTAKFLNEVCHCDYLPVLLVTLRLGLDYAAQRSWS